MKTVSIRELHNRTGAVVRTASRHGDIRITDNGRIVAKIVAASPVAGAPYFSRRQPTAAFNKLDKSGKTGRGRDITAIISEDREERQ